MCSVTQKLENNISVTLVAKLVKNLPVVQETGVQSLGQEDPVEKGMATHSRILPGNSRRAGW